jgi:hypothetical protein
MSKDWQNWFSAWAVFVAAFGLVLAGGAFEATDGPTRAIFALFGNPWPDSPDSLHRFAIGLMGAVTMGWGLTYHSAFKALFALDAALAAPIWRYLLWVTLIWYFVDSTISISTGIWMNALSNTAILILFLIPLFKSGAMKG